MADPQPPVYSETEVPPYRLPDIGPRQSALDLFANNMYGHLPIEPPEMRVVVVEHDDQALAGLARRRQLRVSLRNSTGECKFTVLLYLPASVPVAPLFLSLNFSGNHTVHPDPAILEPASRVLPADWPAERVKKQERGSWAARCQVEMILRRGYGVATVFGGDFAPDDSTCFEGGIFRLLSPSSDETRGGAVAAWAWGLSRALDVLTTLPEIDHSHIGVMGFSRMGKAALWAAACDERFSLAVSAGSGAGGAALSRRRIGERVVHLNHSFPHWFAPAFRRYNEYEKDLPFDQHQLLALIAPRALYVASGSGDQWADPRGEYLSLAAAAPAWGIELPAESPPLNQPICRDKLGYHVRQGPHDITEYDWQQILDFSDRVWK